MLGLVFRGALFVGAAVATGAVLGPAIWRNGRPIAKSALRSGMEVAEAARVAAARFVEDIEDLVAEVRHEQAEATEDDAATSATAASPNAEPPPNDNQAKAKASND